MGASHDCMRCTVLNCIILLRIVLYAAECCACAVCIYICLIIMIKKTIIKNNRQVGRQEFLVLGGDGIMPSNASAACPHFVSSFRVVMYMRS